ncbi:hypothetical protein Pla110_44500 [Polystyrenella longa]|uniref:Uncharacterized protein n=1 Tax=Polystyrenella longa TaxID=2528007 RepID=A0A518CTX9_9PLAN|nr:hypothetical protein [Polystyrenella longa]QDU82689.1 hypothetical protein Pla110_44500 [Polystyrenella longa]
MNSPQTATPSSPDLSPYDSSNGNRFSDHHPMMEKIKDIQETVHNHDKNFTKYDSWKQGFLFSLPVIASIFWILFSSITGSVEKNGISLESMKDRLSKDIIDSEKATSKDISAEIRIVSSKIEQAVVVANNNAGDIKALTQNVQILKHQLDLAQYSQFPNDTDELFNQGTRQTGYTVSKKPSLDKEFDLSESSFVIDGVEYDGAVFVTGTPSGEEKEVADFCAVVSVFDFKNQKVATLNPYAPLIQFATYYGPVEAPAPPADLDFRPAAPAKPREAPAPPAGKLEPNEDPRFRPVSQRDKPGIQDLARIFDMQTKGLRKIFRNTVALDQINDEMLRQLPEDIDRSKSYLIRKIPIDFPERFYDFQYSINKQYENRIYTEFRQMFDSQNFNSFVPLLYYYPQYYASCSVPEDPFGTIGRNDSRKPTLVH